MKSKITLVLDKDDMEDVVEAMAWEERTAGNIIDSKSNLEGKTIAEICRIFMFMMQEGCTFYNEEDENEIY